ncbi:alpha/beta family hydrolase [Terasakiella pusilla]|jgi:predicted alpha/beta-hydrolase family hydrolase|uniref:alpha/beta family hydrolase n=1 Tax=Terasakiella pusilla TaxID=64973 RepID=UPI003AA81656
MNYLINGPENSDITLAFAHGAGAHMDSAFMERVAVGLGERGIKVVRFEFPYMQKRRETGKKRPPDRTPKLLNAWREIIADLGGPENLFIGGKSLGGRMATMIAAELEAEETPVRGVCVTGYPFHPLGKSEPEYLRTEHLMTLKTPTLICQGARDAMGWWDEVVEYGLPDTIDFHWADDGDHDLKPRNLSGRTMRQNQDEAIEALADWLKAKAAS